jgi:hypothetical protein
VGQHVMAAESVLGLLGVLNDGARLRVDLPEHSAALLCERFGIALPEALA